MALGPFLPPGHISITELSRTVAPSLNYSFKPHIFSLWLSHFALDHPNRPWFFPPDTHTDIDALTDSSQDPFSLHEHQQSASSVIPHPNKPCGHVYKPGEALYRCVDCGFDDTCCLCARCFNPDDHKDHKIQISIHAGGCGCCDCGDPEAWKHPLNCRKQVLADASSDSSTMTTSSEPPPPHLQEQIHFIVKHAVDFMVSTLNNTPKEYTPLQSKEDIQLQLSPQEIESNQQTGLGPWSSVLWNDERHSFEEVISVLRTAIPNMHMELRRQIAYDVHNHGFELLFSSQETDLLYHVSQTVSHIGLCITTRSSQSVFDESLSAFIITWLSDLMQTSIGRDSQFLSRVVAQTLLSTPSQNNHSLLPYNYLEMLLLSDVKLWKEARNDFRQLLILLTSFDIDVKLAVGESFAKVYPQLMSQYLLIDREPENSILNFSVQLFTVPSVAAHVVQKQNLLSKIIQLLYAFFTEQVNTDLKEFIIPPVPIVGTVDYESAPFKHRRYLPLANDFCLLISSPSVQSIIVNSPHYMQEFISIMALFNNLNPMKRATDQHVEYEQDLWYVFFYALSRIARVCRQFGEVYKVANKEQHIAALQVIVAQIQNQAHQARQITPVRPGSYLSEPYIVQQSHFASSLFYLQHIKFNVASQPLSLHHPPNLLAAEVMKTAIQACTPSDILNVLSVESPPLFFFEAPLRVITLLSQIRCGLWVRNGQPIRHQMTTYHEIHRQSFYDQDLFLLQTAIVFLWGDKSDFFFSLADRFGLTDFLEHGEVLSNSSSSVYDEGQAFSMLEDMLDKIVVLISEPADILGWDEQTRMRREIVHALCLGQTAYSDITKRVSDYQTSIDRVLASVAKFVSPDESPNEQGYYVLHDACFEEIDPYYYRFSRNQREEAQNILIKKYGGGSSKKATTTKKNSSLSQEVLVPKPFPDELCNLPAADHFMSAFITAAYTSPVLVYILFASLKRAVTPIQKANFSEAVVDLCIHIIMKHLVQKPVDFANNAGVSYLWKESKQDDDDDIKEERENGEEQNQGLKQLSLIDVLCELERDGRLSSSKSRIRWCLDKLSEIMGHQNIPSLLQRAQEKANTSGTGESATSKKKSGGKESDASKNRALAKSRQQALMKKFSDAQKSFAEKYNFDDDDDLDDDDATVSGHVWYGSCIMCQEDLDPSESFGCLALLQSSRLIKAEKRSPELFEETLNSTPNFDQDTQAQRRVKFMSSSTSSPSSSSAVYKPREYEVSTKHKARHHGINATACGHMMHTRCHDSYFRSIINRNATFPTRNHPEDILRKEFLCPLCKSIGNAVLPVVPEEEDNVITSLNDGGGNEEMDVDVSLDEWVDSLRKDQEAHRVHYEDSRMWAWKIDDMRSLSLQRSFGKDARLVSSFMNVLWPLTRETFRDNQIRYIPDVVIAYTISCIEISQRGQESHPESFSTTISTSSSVSDNAAFSSTSPYIPSCVLNEATERLLKALFLCMRKFLRASYPSTVGNARVDVLTPLVTVRKPHREYPPFLMYDPLIVLCEIASVSPYDLSYVVQLAFYAQLLRVYISIRSFVSKLQPEFILRMRESFSLKSDAYEHEYVELARLASEAWTDILPDGEDDIKWSMFQSMLGEKMLGKLMYSYTLPFLRRAEIVMRLKRIPQRNAVSQGDEGKGIVKVESELIRLLKAMDIPHPRHILANTSINWAPSAVGIRALMKSWATRALEYCSSLNSSSNSSGGGSLSLRLALQMEHPVIYELIQLPYKLETLLEDFESKKCENCKSVPDEPGLCLLCGKLVCMKSFCCSDPHGRESQHGESNRHMWTCGGSVGIYFLIRDCAVLYLYSSQGTYHEPPYLDEHGEIDVGMKRRLRQYLHFPRYEQIRKIWLTHQIPTFVARKLEGADSGGWPTI